MTTEPEDTPPEPEPGDAAPEPGSGRGAPGGSVVPFPSREPAQPASDTSFEVHLDGEPGGAPAPVDTGEGIVLPDPDGEPYPVIPVHLRTVAGVGEALGNAQVGQIRDRYAGGEATQRQLAAEFAVSVSTISAVLTGKTWGWLA